MAAARSRTPPPPAPAGAALIDIDHFKAFNDRFYAAGDTKHIAAEIMTAARVSDFDCRFGEEFVVIADGIAGDEVDALAERIRRAIVDAGQRPGRVRDRQHRRSPPAPTTPST